MLLLQQPHGKLPGGDAQLGDVGEGVKCALGHQAADPLHIVEALHNDLTAASILTLHLLHALLAAVQRGHAAPLHALVHGGQHVFQQLGHHHDDLLRRHRPGQAHAGHGVGLGEAVHHHGALLHAGEAGDAGVGLIVPQQLTVDLIGEDVQVVCLGKVCDLAQVVGAGHAAGGVGRGVQQDHLGLGRKGRLQVSHIVHEAVFLLQADRHRHRAHLHHQAHIVGPARIRHQNLVADIQHGGAGQVQHADGAGADEDLAGLIVQATSLVKIRHRLPQSRDARVGGIVRLAPLQGSHRRVDDVLRGGEIRLAQGEADDIIQPRLQGEHLADNGMGRFLTLIGNE